MPCCLCNYGVKVVAPYLNIYKPGKVTPVGSYAVLDSAVDPNFIDTKNSKRDRRRVLIYLTQAGADFHDKITPKRIETGELIDTCFEPQEKEQLFHLLNKLDRHLEHMKNELDDEWE